MGERLRSNLFVALRSLAATPITTGAAIVLLSVAVGLNLAMLGLIDRAILSPARHVAEPDRVCTLGFEVPVPPGSSAPPGRMTTTSYVAFKNLQEHVQAFSNVAAWRRTSTSAVIAGEQIRADAMLVSGSYFELLGVVALQGRILGTDHDRDAAGAPAAVLSHAFWRSAFGSDKGVLGRRLTLRGVEYTITGVMRPGFSGHSTTRVDIWVPMAAAMREMPGWDQDPFRNVTSIIARLRPGESAPAAAAQASAVLDRRVALSSIAGGEVAQTERRIVYALTGVSLLVFVIGLANTATLLLLRASRRRRECAIRSALGASRARLLTHVMIEAGVLATVSTSGAFALSSWFDEGLRRVLLSTLTETAGMSARTLLAALLAGLAAFALAGLVGLGQLPRLVNLEDLAAVSRDRRRSKAHAVLLVVQTTLSVALIAGAGMFARSLYTLVRQDFGMRLDHVVLVEFERGSGRSGLSQILEEALQRIRVLPEVALATPVQIIPFTGFHVLPVGIPGKADSPSVDGQLPYLLAATPELFEILGIEIVQGRRFTIADDRGAPVVIVNETMARGAWPGESAIGRCIRIGFDESFDPLTAQGPPGPPTSVPCREVVGVARDVRQRSVVPTGNESRLMQYFVPFSQVPPPPGRVSAGPMVQGLLLRTSIDSDSLTSTIRRAVVDGRTDLPFVQVRPYRQLLDRQMEPWRLGTVLLIVFGALALAVSAVGLYAAFSHAVAERRREMAIRMAIGAGPSRMLAMILREAAVIAGVGVLCGSVVTILGGRGLSSMLFGTAPSDPLVLGSAALVMIAVSVLATLLPARNAARTDPASLLRTE
jgi:putative ABC transport system permease protein